MAAQPGSPTARRTNPRDLPPGLGDILKLLEALRRGDRPETAAAMIRDAIAGMMGAFPDALRDAIYGWQAG
ncbi:hypothetical protein [Mesorhizobium sp. B4-1-1]|uniref:hypothetical protein n=1 Tax=Mesorhizobium sp. B4-1-1 TaxID=2589890 RepID=UPI001FEDEF9C|nr:hypothetical protein [Mesorhizobium sp. B4-1-1]